jgi:octaprenyl-diphosphate synthase
MSYNAQSMKTVLTQQEIYGLVAGDLVRVEDELKVYTRSSIEPISEIGRYLIDAGGKRVRPALLLLTARMLGGISDSTIRLAAVMEFIHNATLVHDDVIDGSDTRRGRPSANANWGNAMTVLAGDWLYMESFAVALGERNFDVLNTLIGITQKMVEGELLQLTLVGRKDVGDKHLLDIARRKTAHLFSGCMRLPAIAADGDPGSVEKLTRIGMNLGMSFQLVDDLLDLTSTKEAMGKPVASDLKEGKVTLPVYYALEQGTAEDRRMVELVLEERDFRSVKPEDILELVERADGVKRTRVLAADFARQAIRELETFPPTPYRDAIISIPEFIINRQM